MSGLLDELLEETTEPEKKPEPVGKFTYSDAFTEYIEKNKPAVGGEHKDE